MNERSMGFPGMWPTNPREDRLRSSPTGIAPAKFPQNGVIGNLPARVPGLRGTYRKPDFSGTIVQLQKRQPSQQGQSIIGCVQYEMCRHVSCDQDSFALWP